MKASRILVILLCLAVCTLFSVLYVRHYVVQPAASPTTVEVSATASAGTDAALPTAAPAAPTYSTLPRFATQAQQFVCNVTGTTGEESALDYYAFGGYVYVVLSTDTDGQDYRAAGPSLAVARFDSDCTLRDTLTLPQSAGYTYLCASLGDYGLVVCATDGHDLRVWAVSVNLVAKTQAYPYAPTRARMVYGSEGNVLVFAGDKLYAMCLSSTLNVLWLHAAAVDGMHPLAVYITASTYTVVCTSATQGAAYTLNALGFVTRIPLGAIDAITPCATGYAVVNSVLATLSLYDAAFGLVKTVSIPRAGYVAVTAFTSGLVLLSGGAEGYSGLLVCNHGDALCTFSLEAGTLASVPSLSPDGDILYALQTSGAWQLYRYTPFAAAPVAVCRVQGAADAHYWLSGGYLYCVCDSNFDYGCFASCIGGGDVYLLRTPYGAD